MRAHHKLKMVKRDKMAKMNLNWFFRKWGTKDSRIDPLLKFQNYQKLYLMINSRWNKISNLYYLETKLFILTEKTKATIIWSTSQYSIILKLLSLKDKQISNSLTLINFISRNSSIVTALTSKPNAFTHNRIKTLIVFKNKLKCNLIKVHRSLIIKI